MPELLAAYADHAATVRAMTGRTPKRGHKRHVVVAGHGGCGVRVDTSRAVPAAQVDVAERCGSTGCRGRWPDG